MSLHNDLRKLAAQHPEFKPHLAALLKQSSAPLWLTGPVNKFLNALDAVAEQQARVVARYLTKADPPDPEETPWEVTIDVIDSNNHGLDVNVRVTGASSYYGVDWDGVAGVLGLSHWELKDGHDGDYLNAYVSVILRGGSK